MKAGVVALGALVVLVIVLLLAGGSYVSAKNTMVAKNEAVNQQFHQVQVVEQRRLDLIPNLVASVKGYVNEETTVLTNIANARAGVVAASSSNNNATKINADKQLDLAISPLLRLQEAYPNLKADQRFKELTDELAGTENRIAVERQKYNKTLEDYNIFVKQFPNSFWAGFAGYHARDEYYTEDDAAKKAPTVDFSK